MSSRSIRAVLAVVAMVVPLAAQNWTAAKGTTTSSLHSGSYGGAHEHIELSNAIFTGGGPDDVVVTIVHFVLVNGEVEEQTVTTAVPYGQTRSWHLDVKTITVTAGGVDAQGQYKVTYP